MPAWAWVQEPPVGLAPEQREQRPQGLGGVPEQDDLGGAGAAQPGRVGLDLDGPDPEPGRARWPPTGSWSRPAAGCRRRPRACSDGRVPSTPMQPVVNGWSSGTAALPGRDLTTGPATASATASSSSRASSAPAPTSRATRPPWLSTSAARCRSASGGTPGPAVNSGAVGGVPVGVVSIHGLVSAAVSSRPGGKVMCETVPLARAWPIPMSTTAGICTGTLTRTL